MGEVIAMVGIVAVFALTSVIDQRLRARDRKRAGLLVERVHRLELIIVSESRLERCLRGELVKDRETVEQVLKRLEARAEAEAQNERIN